MMRMKERETVFCGWRTRCMLYTVDSVLGVLCTRCMQYAVHAELGVCCTLCMLFSVYAVLGVWCSRCMRYLAYDVLCVCCTRCRLYSVYAVLGVWCTQCMLCLVYAVLGVCCTQCQLVIVEWRDREGLVTFEFCDVDRVVDQTPAEGGWRWGWSGWYELKWAIRVMTRLIRSAKPCIGVISCWIGSRACRIVNSPLTGTLDSLNFQSLMMIYPISSHLSLCRPQFHDHLKTQTSVIPLYLPMSWSRVNTELSIYLVQHTVSTACTRYCIIPTSTVVRSQPVSYSFAHYIRLNLLFSHNHELTNEKSLSSCHDSLRNYRLLKDWLQVLLHSRLVMASKCSSKLTRSQASIASPPTQSQAPSISPNLPFYVLKVYLQPRLILEADF